MDSDKTLDQEGDTHTPSQNDAEQIDLKAQKLQAKQERLEVREKKLNKTAQWLIERFPKCFSFSKPVPLKIGISKDIRTLITTEEEAPSYKALRRAISGYTNTWRYYSSFMHETHRIDLEGNQVEEISLDDINYAKKIRRERFPFPKKIENSDNI